MDNKIHDLDEGLVEYFEFKLFGKVYRFRQLNTEEIKVMQGFTSDGNKLTEYMYEFITKVDQDAPEFKEVYKKMTLPHLKKFNKMISEEFGIEEK